MIVRRKTFVDLKAKVLEYEHALDHVASDWDHQDVDGRYCPSCIKLAQSALGEENREDFLQIAKDFTGIRAKLRSWYWDVYYKFDRG